MCKGQMLHVQVLKSSLHLGVQSVGVSAQRQKLGPDCRKRGAAVNVPKALAAFKHFSIGTFAHAKPGGH